MVDKKSLFIKADKLRNIYKIDANYEVVIWGTGEVALEVFRTLEGYSIPVHYFADNSTKYQPEWFQAIPILSAQEVADLKNPLIIIGSFVVRPILEQLLDLGIKHIYVLIDSLKYPYNELLQEYQDLLINTDKCIEYDTNKNKTPILIEVYGNIGDVVLKGGIFNFLIDQYGIDDLYFLVETESIADFMHLFTKNVMVGDKLRISVDKNYRRKLLMQLNEKNFGTSFILADIRLHFTRRFLNDLNFKTQDIRYHSSLPSDNYLPSMDELFIKKEFNLPNEYNLSARGCLDNRISLLPFVYGLPDNYVVLNFGATKDIRHYDVKKAAKVINYLNQYQHICIIIGNGRYDDWFYTKLMEYIDKKDKVISYVSKLTLLESFYVIYHSDFFIGTDSGMWNVSYIMGKESVVIYGGGEYGNFMHCEDFVHYAMTHKYECFGCKWYCNNKTESGYARCIDDITPEMIINQIKEVILR